MPGIVGIIGLGPSEEKKAELFRMLKCMMHEVFYSSGTYIHQNLGLWLGWVSHKNSFSEHMPIWNEKEDIGMIFSGEDYADPAEIRQLRAGGHIFEPGSASYLVHLYEKNGISFVQKLNGRYCGIIIDLREGQTFLFNDRHGLSRIYFFEYQGIFFFSSEAKAILLVFPGLRRICPRSLGEMIACGCVLQNRTLYPGISLVPGGSVWTFAPGVKTRKTFYFQPESWELQEQLSDSEYFHKLKDTWAHILPRYVCNKEQVAVSLTGGKDSRMIMAWAPSFPGTLPCYTFSGPYRDCQDVKLARRVAKICGQTHQVISVGKAFLSEFPSLAEKTVYLTDGTMDVSGAAELYVNRLARQIAPVRLTGNYGQEILQSYVAFRPQNINVQIFQKDFRQHLEFAAQTYRDELGVNPLTFITLKQMPWYHYSRLALEQSQLTPRSPFLDKDIISLSYQAPRALYVKTIAQLRLIAEGNRALAEFATDQGDMYKPTPLLTKGNQLIQKLKRKVEYAYDYGMPQWLVRFDRILRQFHPESVFLGWHKFVHFRIWYRAELSGYIKDILLDPKTLRRSYINQRFLENIVSKHINGIGNYTTEIHKILTIELIYRQFIDGDVL